MFDALPETRSHGTPFGKGAVSTSLIAHGGLLVGIIAISLLARVTAGDPPPIPIDWVLVTPQITPKLGDSTEAGGKRQPPKAAHPAEQTAEKHPMAQPTVTPEPPAPPAVEPPPQPSSTALLLDLNPVQDTSTPPGGGDESGPGQGPGNGPGIYGVPWGDLDGQGTGGPSTADNPDEILRIGGDVEGPRLVRRVEPEYPRIAILARVQGTVILEGVIGTTGRIESLRVLKSAQLLDDAALRAVGQWRYTPARRGGVPVKVYLSIRVEFRLE